MHEAKTHLGDEYLLIKEGELTVRFESEEHELVSGDALHFQEIPLTAISIHLKKKQAFLLMHYRIIKRAYGSSVRSFYCCVGLFFFIFVFMYPILTTAIVKIA